MREKVADISAYDSPCQFVPGTPALHRLQFPGTPVPDVPATPTNIHYNRSPRPGFVSGVHTLSDTPVLTRRSVRAMEMECGERIVFLQDVPATPLSAGAVIDEEDDTANHGRHSMEQTVPATPTRNTRTRRTTAWPPSALMATNPPVFDVRHRSRPDVTSQRNSDITSDSSYDVKLKANHDGGLQAIHDVRQKHNNDARPKSNPDVRPKSNHDVRPKANDNVRSKPSQSRAMKQRERSQSFLRSPQRLSVSLSQVSPHWAQDEQLHLFDGSDEDIFI